MIEHGSGHRPAPDPHDAAATRGRHALDSTEHFPIYLSTSGGGNMQDTRAKFQIHEAAPGCLVVKCSGGLSWEDRDLLAESIDQCLGEQQQIKGLVLDMARVTFVNSAGLGALFQLVERVRSHGGELILACVPPALLRLFRAVGLNRTVRMADDVNSGVRLLNEPSADEDLHVAGS